GGRGVEHEPHGDVVDVDDSSAGAPVQEDGRDPRLLLERGRACLYRCLTADGVELPEDTRATALGEVLKVVQRERYDPTPHEGCSSLSSPAASHAAARALRSLSRLPTKPPTAPTPSQALTIRVRLVICMAPALVSDVLPGGCAIYERIVSMMRLPRYRRKAKGGPCSGTHRTGPPRAAAAGSRASGLGLHGVVVHEAPLQYRPLAGRERAEDALEVLHGGELDGDLALLLAQVDLHSRLEPIRETGRQVGQRRRDQSPRSRALGLRGLLRPRTHQVHDLLDGPDREALGDDAVSQPVLLLGVVDRQKGSRVARGEHPGGDAVLHPGRQQQQAQGVGDLRPGPADAVGQLVVGAVEIPQQLVVGRGLLQRVELGAVQVLQQGVQEELLVLGGPDDRRDLLQTRLTAGPPAALTHDELVLARTGLPDDDRLEEADLLDGGDELREGVVVEYRTRLTRVRSDRVQRNLREVRTDGRRESVRRRQVLCFT